MQAIPGGAAAQPFKTFHNALGCEFYLRIALELYHKRLLVGGIDKLFEIGKNFRNEGLSRRHNPEFTMLEAYQAFGDYETMMETVESLITTVAQKVLGTLVIYHPQRDSLGTGFFIIEQFLSASVTPTILDDLNKHFSPARSTFDQCSNDIKECLKLARTAETTDPLAVRAGVSIQSLIHALRECENTGESGSDWRVFADNLEKLCAKLGPFTSKKEINLRPPWRRAKYKDLVRETAGADWFDVSPAERRQRAHDLGAEIGKEYEDFEVTGAVFEKLIEPTLVQPTFVTHLPKELVPLAKLSPDDPTTVEVFECCINGQEIAPGYTEQNDPIAQRTTLEHQAGGEQQKLDEDFLVALEHGMPPAGGIGIGIDRLCMMLLGQESIRDVILFPQLKPK